MGAPRTSIPRSSQLPAWLALVLLAAGCASAPRAERAPGVFFPPPPELPRIQYLTSFNGLKDVEEQSRFERFVVGENPDVRLDKPYGVAIHEGKIYVCDTNATVVVFDLPGKTFGILKGAADGPGKLAQPVNISIADDGTKYVADPGRGQVVVYGPDDEYVRAYGTPGTWRPVDAVAHEGRIYVADNGNGVVAVLDAATGEVVKTIGKTGEPEALLGGPTNLAFDRDGKLYVTDFAGFRVAKFDRDGHHELTFGRPGDNLGHFARPKGIALDREGRLFAVDASFSNVQIFSPKGRILMFFGQGGERPGDLLLPAKVTIDYDNLRHFAQYVDPDFQAEALVLVTSQFGPRLVNVFALGKRKGARYPTEEELLRQIEAKRKAELEKLEKP